MNCDSMRARLAELAYNELSDEDRVPLDAHLAGCEVCRRAWDELREGVDLLRALDQTDGRVRPGVDINKLYDLLAATSARRARLWKRMAGLAAALAATVLVLAAMHLHVDIHARHVTIGWGKGPVVKENVQGTEHVTAPGRRALNGLATELPTGSQVATDRLAAASENHARQFQQLQERFDILIEALHEGQARQNTAIAAMVRQINQVREENDARWQASSAAWEQNDVRLALFRRGMDELLQVANLGSEH